MPLQRLLHNRFIKIKAFSEMKLQRADVSTECCDDHKLQFWSNLKTQLRRVKVENVSMFVVVFSLMTCNTMFNHNAPFSPVT